MGIFEQVLRETAGTLPRSAAAIRLLDSWGKEDREAFAKACGSGDHPTIDRMLGDETSGKSFRYRNGLADDLKTAIEEDMA